MAYEEETGTPKDKALRKYRKCVESAQKWRADEYDEEWRSFINLYANKHFIEDEWDDFSESHKISVGVSFSTINIIYPSVSIARPKVTVTATHPGMIDIAETAEAVVNYWWRHYDYQDEFRQCVKDYLIVGHGWIKTTYLFAEEEKPRSEDEIRGEISEMLAQKYEAVDNNPQDEYLYPSDEEIIDGVPTVKKVVLEDHPQLERVSPFDMYVDPDASRLFDARWIAQRIAVPVEEAKKRKDWNAKARQELCDSAKQVQESDGAFEDQIDPDQKFVIIYEYYNLTENTVCTFGLKGDSFLSEPAPIKYSFGHPFVMLRNYEVPEKLYPMGELECLKPLQLELDFTRSAQLRDLLGHTRQHIIRKGTLDTENMQRLSAGRDGELVLAEETAPDDLSRAIAAVPVNDIPQHTFQMSEVIQGDMTRTSGVSDYAMGAMPEIRRTATEAGIIQDSANARAADKLAQIELTLAKLARRILQLGQEFLTVESTARIAGEDGSVQWVEFDKEAIQGEFDFEIEAGSTQPQNETFRRQSALQLMDAMSSPMFAPQPDPMTGMPVPIVDPRKLAEHVLRYGFGIKNPQDFLVPEPPEPPIDPMTGMPMQPGGEMGGLPGEVPPEGGGEEAPPPQAPPAF
jgi:hypothetical protein